MCYFDPSTFSPPLFGPNSVWTPHLAYSLRQTCYLDEGHFTHLNDAGLCVSNSGCAFICVYLVSYEVCTLHTLVYRVQTLPKQILLAWPICQILESILAHKSKSLHTLGLNSYIKNRQLKNCKSSLLNLRRGVLQGSILGPKLFILYLTDIHMVSNTLNCFICRWHQYSMQRVESQGSCKNST